VIKRPEIASRKKRSVLWDVPMPCGHTNYVHTPPDQTEPPAHKVCYICHPSPSQWVQLPLPGSVMSTGRGKRLTK
jgi:hypothetical protein